MTPQSDSSEKTRPGYEQSDLSVRLIAMFVVGLFVLTSVVLLLMWGMFDFFASRQASVDVTPSPLATRQLPPEPRLQVDPAKDLEKMRAAEDATLNSYGWVDRNAGIVRIPIHRAMELVAERGLPARTRKQGKN